MSSITIKCEDCQKDFYFTDRDQEFYKEKGYSEPKRCFNCRKKRKLEWEARQKGDYKRSDNK
jgi:DNA replicative helicase MCM subunit Mcm2 (Cdc46/Mcm family)